MQTCFRLKQQLLALDLLNEAMRRYGWPALQVAGRVIDVRIAQALLTPGSTSVTDSLEFEETMRPAMVRPPPPPPTGGAVAGVEAEGLFSGRASDP